MKNLSRRNRLSIIDEPKQDITGMSRTKIDKGESLLCSIFGRENV